MKKKLLKLAFVVSTVILIALTMSFAASAEIKTGSCGLNGDNVTYKLNTETGLLEISGTGSMYPWQTGASPFHYYQSKIKMVSISEGVTNIGSYAFYDCNSIIGVDISETVASIDKCAFWGCSMLTSITFPKSVNSIGYSAFNGCSSLTSVDISANSNLMSIYDYAFGDCVTLTGITIPASVTAIGNGVFKGCWSLKSIDVDENNRYYCDKNGILFSKDEKKLIQYPCGNGEYAYTIPDGVTAINSYAFAGCGTIASVTMADSIMSIGNSAFEDCGALQAIDICNNVTHIGEKAFYDTSYYITSSNWQNNGAALYIDECLIEVKSTLSNTYSITPGTKVIADKAFEACSELAVVHIPASVKGVGRYSFSGCSNLACVWFRSKDAQIDLNAFAGCSSLDTIYLYRNSTADLFFEEDKYTKGYLSYVVSYNANGGIGAPDSQTADDDIDLLITNDFPTKNGYTFKGWSTKSGGDVEYMPGDVYTARMSVELYAVWEINTYKIVYELNGGEGSIDPQTKTYGVNIYLTNAKPTRSRYVFLGWSTTKEGSVEYNSGAIYKNDASVTLYAVWTNEFKVVYDANGGEGAPTFQIKYFGVDLTLSSLTPTRANYDFIGWALSPSGEAVYAPGDVYTLNSELKLYAVWKVRIISGKCGTNLTYSLNLSTGVMTIQGTGSMSSWAAEMAVVWKAYRSNIRMVIIENGVTSIGGYAFSYCNNLMSVTIPDSVASIGSYAFYDCNKLESVNISYNSALTSIESYAFYGCELLESITIPNGVTSIGLYAFKGCNSLDELYIFDLESWLKVKLSDSSSHPLYSIGGDLYIGGVLATEITIPNSVTDIGSYAFLGCHSLIKVTVPGSVKSIGVMTFYDCENIEEIQLPFVGNGSDQTHFGYIFGASKYSYNEDRVPSSLKTVVITGGENISEYAFYGCGIQNITIPKSVTSIGYQAFLGCAYLENLYIFDLKSWLNVEINGGSAHPLNGNTTANLYVDGVHATKITIPDGVTSIGPYAFYNCNITSVAISPETTSIGDYAFYSCALTDVDIPQNSRLKEIGENAFEWCNNLVNITLPNSVESIGDDAFKDCRGLTKITIPQNVTNIWYAAFKNCQALESVKFMTKNVSITSTAFENCTKLKTIYLHKDSTADTYFLDSEYEKIYMDGYSVYYYANGGVGAPEIQTKLFEIDLALSTVIPTRENYDFMGWAESSSGSVVYAPGDVYTEDRELKLYAIWQLKTTSGKCGDNVTYTLDLRTGHMEISGTGDMYSYTYKTSPPWSYYDSYIKTVFIEQGVTSIGDYAFSYTNNLTSLEVADSVTSIGECAFKGCSNLAFVDFSGSDKLTGIGVEAFSNCSFTSITIPKCVTMIGNGAFTGLKTVYLYRNSRADRYYFGSSCEKIYLDIYTISYDLQSGDGIFEPQSKKDSVDVMINDSIPTRIGYDFKGWLGSDGNMYSAGDIYSGNEDLCLTAVWEIKTYTITYDANGGSGVPGNGQKEYFVNYVISSVAPEKVGYNFIGWLGSDGKSYEAGDVYSKNAELVLTAIWEIKTYTVTYDANGGEGAPESAVKEYLSEYIISSVVPIREGYNFKGWLGSDGKTYFAGNIYYENADISLTAVWEIKVYTINFDANEGENAPASQSKTHDVPLILSVEIPTREGYVFKFWAGSDGETYLSGDTYSQNAALTLTAVWEIKTYSIIYDVNGGIGCPENAIKEHFASYTVESIIPTREGYNFKRWLGSDEKIYYAGDIYSANFDLTLTAVWEIKTYTITYDADGESNVPQNGQKEHFANYVISSVVPEKVGYNFIGWLGSDGKTYGAKDVYSDDADLVLTAVWEIKTYTISYDANGGSGVPESGQKEHFTNYAISLIIPVKEGHTFRYWMGSDGRIYYPGDVYAQDQSLSLTAVWAPHSYTISYDLNGGIETFINEMKYFDIDFVICSYTPTKNGYNFIHWLGSDGKSYVPGSVYSTNADLTLTAVWDPKYVVMTYDPNGGTVSETSKNVQYNTAIGETAIPVRDGYTFTGWGVERDGEEQITSGTVVSSFVDFTVYAHWAPNKYAVSLDAVGGTVAIPDKVVTFDSVYGTLPVPVSTGHTFEGWYTAKDGGKLVTADTVVTTSSDHILYARWKANVYRVYFDANGGECDKDAQNITFGSAYGELPVPERNGYTFVCWSSSKDDVDVVTRKTNHTVAGDVTLYAIWSANTYKLTFDALGGELDVTEKSVTFDLTYGTLPTSVRPNYIFGGWFLETAYLNKVTSDTIVTVVGDHTVYAMWIPVVFNVVYDANGGEGTPDNQTKLLDVDLKLSGIEPTRKGFRFKGWSTSADGAVAYAPGAAYSENANLTLYAVWEAINYGDPTGDGAINAVDAVLLAQKLAGWDVDCDELAADCNGDDIINAVDAVLLAQYLAGWDVSLG